jgi:hypothetical protein
VIVNPEEVYQETPHGQTRDKLIFSNVPALFRTPQYGPKLVLISSAPVGPMRQSATAPLV